MVQGEDCVYPSTRLTPVYPASFTCNCQHEPTARQSQGGDQRVPQSAPGIASSILELELWHHWTVSTYELFIVEKPHGSPYQWQVLIPRLALRHDYLRNALLAMSAVHIAGETRESSATASSTYMLAALEYHSIACQTFRRVSPLLLSDWGRDEQDNVAAVFAFSVINVGVTIAFCQYPEIFDQAPGPEASMLGKITTLLKLLQTIGTVVSLNLEKFSQGSLPVKIDTFEECRRQKLDIDTEMALTRLEDITLQASESDDSVKNANVQAMRTLRECFNFYSTCNQEVVLTWPTMAGMAYLHILDSGKSQVASLILLHWAVLFCRYGVGRRFSGYLGSTLADELSRTIPRTDTRWEACIDWVQRQIAMA
jgi:hypothetical protein